MKKYFALLQGNPLFKGLTEDEIEAVLHDFGAHTLRRKSGEYIFHAGDTTNSMGFVLSGSVLVIQDDVWGHRNIMARIPTGDIFAEIFAAAPGAVMNVSVVADADCEIMMLNVSHMLEAGYSAGEAHIRIVRNLISVLAGKTMAFNNKITHISKRTTRDKLLSFLSAEAIRQGKPEFDIPYNRQQLADYLCVERAAMSVELSKLQKEGLLTYDRSHFELKELTGYSKAC